MSLLEFALYKKMVLISSVKSPVFSSACHIVCFPYRLPSIVCSYRYVKSRVSLIYPNPMKTSFCQNGLMNYWLGSEAQTRPVNIKLDTEASPLRHRGFTS